MSPPVAVADQTAASPRARATGRSGHSSLAELRAASLPWVGFVLVLLVALSTRVAGLDAYVTIDESRWIQRAADFRTLIAQGDLEDTFIVGHPGVTTMWTASIGMGPEAVSRMSFRSGREDVTRREGYLRALIDARWPFAVLAAAGAAAIGFLSWPLLGLGPALLAGGLVAIEPFLVAHARVVHLDSMLTVYSTLCLLAAMHWLRGGGTSWMLVSGVFGGLAFLTKAPSVYVLGFVPLMLVGSALWPGRRGGRSGTDVLRVLLVWGGVAALVALALWPALRIDPLGTLAKMAEFTERVGGGEHDNFFLGVPLDDPGPLFYPVALSFRLSPITLIGVVAAIAAWRVLPRGRREVMLVLLVYGLGFATMMSVAPKKFDRYLLPIVPMLGLVSGLGWWHAITWVVGRVDAIPSTRPSTRFRRLVVGGFVASLLGLHAAPLLAIHPYALAYYNPLLGGGSMAQRVLLVGWGEGLDQVARYLDGQPRVLGEPTVATSYHRVLQAHLAGSAVPLERIRLADYVVPYVNTLQRGGDRDLLAPFIEAGPPEYAVRVNGIEYARVYRGPHYPRTGAPLVDFEGAARLVEFLAAPGSGLVWPGDEVVVQLRWDRPPDRELIASVALVDVAGRPVTREDRPVGADGPDGLGRPGEVHRVAVPGRLAPGDYAVEVRVHDAGAQRALLIPGGVDAARIMDVRVEPGR